MQVPKCVIIVLIICTIGADSTVATDDECSNQLISIKTIDQMLEFIAQLEQEKLIYSSTDNKNKNNNNGNEIDNIQLPKSMRRCMAEYDSIVDLKNLLTDITEGTDVCHPDKVRAIIDYKRQHLSSGRTSSWSKLKLYNRVKTKRLVRHFFRRLVLQIALVCRDNLLANLQEASDELSDLDMSNVMPWLAANANANVTVNDELMNEQLKVLQDTRDLFGSITSIDQVSPWIRYTTTDKASKDQASSSLVLRLMNAAGDKKVEQIRSTCRRMESFYEGSIMSIVRLADAGFAWDSEKLAQIGRDKLAVDKTSKEQRQLLANWLVATVVCGSLFAYDDERHERIHYHRYERNLHHKINTNQPFEVSEQFVSRYSKSTSRVVQFADQFTMKVAMRASQMIRSLSSWSTLRFNSHSNAQVRAYLAQIQRTADRISREGSSFDWRSKMVNAIMIIIMAAVVIVMIMAFLSAVQHG